MSLKQRNRGEIFQWETRALVTIRDQSLKRDFLPLPVLAIEREVIGELPSGTQMANPFPVHHPKYHLKVQWVYEYQDCVLYCMIKITFFAFSSTLIKVKLQTNSYIYGCMWQWISNVVI